MTAKFYGARRKGDGLTLAPAAEGNDGAESDAGSVSSNVSRSGRTIKQAVKVYSPEAWSLAAPRAPSVGRGRTQGSTPSVTAEATESDRIESWSKGVFRRMEEKSKEVGVKGPKGRK